MNNVALTTYNVQYSILIFNRIYLVRQILLNLTKNRKQKLIERSETDLKFRNTKYNTFFYPLDMVIHWYFFRWAHFLLMGK